MSGRQRERATLVLSALRDRALGDRAIYLHISMLHIYIYTHTLVYTNIYIYTYIYLYNLYLYM